jgi:hypothetical protein
VQPSRGWYSLEHIRCLGLAWLGWLGLARGSTLDARDALEDACFGFALAERLIALRAAMLDDRYDAIDERHVWRGSETQ